MPSVGAYSQSGRYVRGVGELVELLVDLEGPQQVGVQVQPDPLLAESGLIRLEEPLARPPQPALQVQTGVRQRAPVAGLGPTAGTPTDVVERAKHGGDVAKRRSVGHDALPGS